MVTLSRTATPYHLYVVVHGFNSNPGHMAYIANTLAETTTTSSVIYVSRSSSDSLWQCSHPTHDGVQNVGARLADEVSAFVRYLKFRKKLPLQFISFVGVSMGGLFARFAIGVLFDCHTGLVAGLEPVSFVTLASSHVGMRQLVSSFVKCVVSDCNVYGGLTARQSFLTDDNSYNEPLFLQLTSDIRYPFMTALKSFRHRTCYANICSDPLVPYPTAAIARSHYTDWRHVDSISDEHPHVVGDTCVETTSTSPSTTSYPADDVFASDIRDMLTRLERVGWRRVDVRFVGFCCFVDCVVPFAPDCLMTWCVGGHNSIAVGRPCMDAAGKDVVRHMCSVLVEWVGFLPTQLMM